MAADVSLVYLSTASTILYFSSCPLASPTLPLDRLSLFLPTLSPLPPSFSLFLSPPSQRFNRPASVSSPFSRASSCHPVPATEGCHAGLTRCICLPRTLLAERKGRRGHLLFGIHESIPDTCRERKIRAEKSVRDNAARRRVPCL